MDSDLLCKFYNTWAVDKSDKRKRGLRELVMARMVHVESKWWVVFWSLNSVVSVGLIEKAIREDLKEMKGLVRQKRMFL